VFVALSERRFGALHRLTPEPEVEREQIADALLQTAAPQARPPR
jgi:hypothetical protein